METADQLEQELIVKEDNDLLTTLRPHQDAQRISRKKMLLIAAESGDEDMIHFAMKSDSLTIYWKVDDDYVEQQISVKELPTS